MAVARPLLLDADSVNPLQELFWTFPDLEPLYGAFKTYLEIPQRLNVITGRVDVLQDMLRLLKVRA
jgi:uncharacterized Rmd1/YagE family protein